jgi:signal transduction histidine kinase/CheY-like chemotaxis protein
MSKWLRNFYTDLTFRRQLATTFTVGVLMLALVSSVTTSWLGSQRTRSNLIEQGKQVTENFARQSILALLYEEGENALDAARGALEFPDVQYVAVYDLRHNLLLEQGKGNAAPFSSISLVGEHEATLVNDNPDQWRFMSYVYTDPAYSSEEELLFMDVAEQERLGYVDVVLSKASMHNTVTGIFLINISISLAFAIGILVMLRYITRRLTNPLDNLSAIMALAEKGETQVCAKYDGPKEIAVMAHAFNNMMGALAERDQQLREQNEQLEQRVAERTAELAIARDDALRASQTKSAFLANMSHELRTPLNAIIGYSEILEEEAAEAGLEQFGDDLKKIHGAGNHLLTLINNVLDLSKIEAGKMELDLDEFSISSLMDDVQAVAAPLAKKNNNKIVFNFPGDVGRMKADPTKLRQALLNLVSNACKFTENGTVSLEVTTEPVDGAQWVLFTVKDNGIGMTEEQKEQIFQDFTQADTTTTRKYGGTGLGLAISQRFCRMMGGNITVESEANHGTAFTIRLPRVVRQRQPVSPVEARTIKERRTSVSNILIIDENFGSRSYIQNALNAEGFAVLTAPSSSEGLKIAQALQPNAIVINVHNPDFDAVSFLSQVKHDPELVPIPTFLLSVSKGLDKGYALNVTHIVSEPINGRPSILPAQFDLPVSESILILEDEEKTAAALQKAFSEIGHSAMYVNNASDALQQIEKNKPGMLLLDPATLRVNGNPLLTHLHQQRDLRATPVVLLKNSQPFDKDPAYTASLQSAFDDAEYSADEFIANFTYQLAVAQRSNT